MSRYVCSYCGAEAYYDGRCGDGPVLVCGHESTGDWDQGTYREGRGKPVDDRDFNPSSRIAELEAELSRLRGPRGDRD